MHQHGTYYFALIPPPTHTHTHTHPDPGDGLKRSKVNFFRHGEGAFQIEWDHECSNMVANILPTDPPPNLKSYIEIVQISLIL